MKMKGCPNPTCKGSEDSLEIVEDERCNIHRCCWVHCDWCGVAGPTGGSSDESAIELWNMLPRITEENYAALKDEFNRGAELAQQHCPKPPLGHSVFEGIPLLAAEVARLKKETKRLPELTWKAERYEAICDIFGYARGSDVGPVVESVKKEWAQLRGGITISVEQAQEASQLGSQAAAVHTVRACAQWLRQNCGWLATVEYAATEMESHMTQDVNRTYGTSGMCVPSKVKEGMHSPEISKPEFDKLCARVEVLEQALLRNHECLRGLDESEDPYNPHNTLDRQAEPAARSERKRIVSYIRNIGGDYHTTVSTKTLAEEIENGNHWKKI